MISPIGFVCDHIEVLWDLDEEAAGVCREIGVEMARAEAANAQPVFIDMMTDVVRRTITRAERGRPLRIVAEPKPVEAGAAVAHPGAAAPGRPAR